MTQPSHYRELHARRDLDVVVSVAESNIRVAGTNLNVECVRTTLAKARRGVEECIHGFPPFLTSLTPVELPSTVPAIARRMANAAKRAGVGPMAAVAAAIAETVAWDLVTVSPEVLVENGGGPFLHRSATTLGGVGAGFQHIRSRTWTSSRSEARPLWYCEFFGNCGRVTQLRSRQFDDGRGANWCAGRRCGNGSGKSRTAREKPSALRRLCALNTGMRKLQSEGTLRRALRLL